MKNVLLSLSILVFIAISSGATAVDDLTIDSAIGGAVGGAIGGAVGAELGGREGAIVGAGVGAATGAAINTRDHAENDGHGNRGPGSHPPPTGRFCPPGQAKKGRC